MQRRAWLVLGVLGLVLSAASRSTAASPAEVEVEGYAGSSIGSWACGPTARATYAGVGGNARLHLQEEEDSPNPEPHGLAIGVGGGTENRSFTRIACANTPCTANDTLPEARWLGAGRANLGYDWTSFGLRAGVMAFPRWATNTDRHTELVALPEGEVRFGRLGGFHGGVGFGAYDVSTNFRPGAYLSMGYASGPFAAELRGGLNLVFDDQIGGRLDASFRYSVTRGVAPGFGIALSTAESTTPEGRLFVVFTP